MSLLITGGAGYIGSHAALRALRDGRRVVVLDNLFRGNADVVDTLRDQARLLNNGSTVEFVRADLLDTAAVREALARFGVTGVLHFAALAYVGESVTMPLEYYRANVAGTLSLLQAFGPGVKAMVFSSTCATFGTPAPDRLPINESTPQQPINPYGASKLMIERVLADFAHARRAAGGPAAFRFAALRYFNVAGCDRTGVLGERHEPETHLIPVILRALLAPQGAAPVTIHGTDYPTPDGTCIRDYIHVDDLVDAHFRVLAALEAGGNAGPGQDLKYNLGIGRGFSVKEVIAACERVTGRTVNVRTGPRREGDPPTLTADSSAIARDLGWRAAVTSLDDIIASAWRWFSTRTWPGGAPVASGGAPRS